MAEQIVTDGALGLGYEYFLFNTGATPIDGFSVFTGPAGAICPLQIATKNGGADAIFPPVVGAPINKGIPFLAAYSSWMIPAPGVRGIRQPTGTV